MAIEEFPEGTVTLLFTDVEGSTGLGERAGDQTARRILREHDDLIRSQVAAHGGREVKALGDGFMVGFSSARRAVECAIAIQRAFEEQRRRGAASVHVKMGLNAGEAIHEDGDLFGSAVSAAARIAGKAKGGEILVSEVVKALIGARGDVGFKDRGRLRLKGFEDRWRLFEVVWQEEAAPAVDGRTPFVARDEERALLRGHLDRLAEGRGGLVLIGGEPGVGKTRIAEEIGAEARQRGFRTLSGRCYEMGSPPPYLPFIELLENASKEVDRQTFRLALGDSAGEVAKVMPQLRNLYDDLPPPLDLPAEQERRYLFNSICEFVTRAASVRPLVALLDDVHWADESSVLLMEHIAQTLDEVPVLVLATYRDTDLDVSRPLAGALDALTRRRLADRLALKRLSLDGVEAMLSKLGGRPPPPMLVEAIFRETDGNAFFVEEVFRHLSEEGRLFDPSSGEWRTDLSIDELEVPEGVRLVIGRRLQRVGEVVVKALTAAAVIGRTFSFDVLEMVVDASEDELLDAMDEAQQSHLIVPSGDRGTTGFAFVHELIRQTLLNQVAAPRRQRLHLRVAEAMEKFYAGSEGERAAQIADHFYQAGAAAPADKTMMFLTLAGDNALRAAAFEDALRFYEEALALLDPEDESGRARLLFKLGTAQRSLGRLDEGLVTWREAVRLYEALGDARQVGAITSESALQLGWAGRWEEAVELAARGLQALGAEVVPERARLLGITGIALSWAGQHDLATSMIDDSLRVATELGDAVQLGSSLTARSAHDYAYLRPREALQASEGAAQLLRSAGDLWTLVNALSFAVFSRLLLGEVDEAQGAADELDSLATRLGHAGGSMFALRFQGITEYERTGDLDMFEKFGHRDRELCERHELPWTAQSYTFLARAKFLKGELAEAWAFLEQAASIDPPGALWGYSEGFHVLYLAYTEPARAEEMAPRVASALPTAGTPSVIGLWLRLLTLAETYAVLGDAARCRELFPLVQEALATGLEIRFDQMPVAASAAFVAAVAGEFDAMPGLFERATAQIELDPEWVLSHESMRLQAQALITRDGPGDRDRAETLLDTAIAFFAEKDLPMSEQIARDVREKIAT
ncbi:MAG: AAA family ATPase [Actinomycetota bacterium]|nr:AAA family ATPase [Actinomycetota bacterium]